jgi:hypothetical protein
MVTVFERGFVPLAVAATGPKSCPLAFLRLLGVLGAAPTSAAHTKLWNTPELRRTLAAHGVKASLAISCRKHRQTK